MDNNAAKWYILQSYAGHEKKAKDLILKELKFTQMEDLVEEIYIPSEDISTKVKGKTKKRTVTYYPGYILIKMSLTDNLWHLLDGIPRIAGFAGKDQRNPITVSEEELEVIRSQIQTGIKQAEVDSTYQIGQSVQIIEGVFSDFVGTIDHVNSEKNKLIVLVNIFGRSTPVELTFDKIKLNE